MSKKVPITGSTGSFGQTMATHLLQRDYSEMHNKKILVTGATGFVGTALVHYLLAQGAEVISLQRRDNLAVHNTKLRSITGFDTQEAHHAINGVDCIVHLASRNHQTGRTHLNAEAEYKKDILELTTSLAHKAKNSDNSPRFIYLSSINVRNGSDTLGRSESPYAYYKFQTEKALKEIFQDAPDRMIILRPPLVYDLEAPANFGMLVKIVKSGLPIPVPFYSGKRAMISRDNLLEAIWISITFEQSKLHKDTDCAVYEISDGNPYDLVMQLQGIAHRTGKKIMLLKVPNFLMAIVFSLIGKRALYNAFTTDLSVEDKNFRSRFNWSPQHSWLDDN